MEYFANMKWLGNAPQQEELQGNDEAASTKLEVLVPSDLQKPRPPHGYLYQTFRPRTPPCTSQMGQSSVVSVLVLRAKVLPESACQGRPQA